MALRNILKDNEDTLKKTSRAVTAFDERLATLIDDMIETLDDARGYGLAACQVGVLRRIFISVDERNMPERDENGQLPDDYKTEYIEFINPEIISTDGEITQYEGCLSFPERTGEITRPQTVTVRAYNRKGEEFELVAEDMLARCICHENDHLDGVTILDIADHFYEDLSDEELDAMEE